ncbi:lipoyltransferase 1, mitochondrial isoform X2 [Neocloeon triangulifer]|uniref:lipoyltransferase 1, mitochondrial isoform X2 n=1 Tax=Neocloeon triangulifer TaxID=2078957 RepID=UPI00286F89B9|nr:lipoyltransferase 1, mitochondrial isoform X2 [Neocloeon triangulifer]
MAMLWRRFLSSWTLRSQTPKTVLISQSDDIFSNLALEDWLYKNQDLSERRVLLLWRNRPAVVIGRHQNPWREAHVGTLAERKVQLARRNSGGGAVYHDLGNLNLSFMTPRDGYNRQANLQVISNALRREFALESEISPRHDLLIDGKLKISGTASKLGRPNAYHHCTLLADVDLDGMKGTLNSDDSGIETRATDSVRSPVVNLSSLQPQVSVTSLMGAVGREYLRSDDEGRDLGKAAINRQLGFALVNPTDEWFPGLEKSRAEFVSWSWRFGKTPDFTVTREFAVPRDMCVSEGATLKVHTKVVKGLVAAMSVTVPPGFASAAPEGEVAVLSGLEGRKFCEEAVTLVEEAFAKKDDSPNKKRFVADCVRRVVQ